MADKTGIEWTEATWNPVVGCSVASDGCTNCYAAREAAGRLSATPTYKGLTVRKAGVPTFTGEVRLLPERLDQPLRWGRPRLIFVNSMSDLFHPGVPTEFIAEVFAVMALARKHTFQVLTKRPNRMAQLLGGNTAFRDQVEAAARARGGPSDLLFPDGASLRWPLSNVWPGTSVEDQPNADLRLPYLQRVAAHGWLTWVSAEPLLASVDLRQFLYGGCAACGGIGDDRNANFRCDACAGEGHMPGLAWVVVGGESGPRSRPMHVAWARQLRDDCAEAHVPFLFKQWGEWGWPASPSDHALTIDGRLLEPGTRLGMDHMAQPTFVRKVGKKRAGRQLDGRTWDGYPEQAARV